jgi:hypothetical protein
MTPLPAGSRSPYRASPSASRPAPSRARLLAVGAAIVALALTSGLLYAGPVTDHRSSGAVTSLPAVAGAARVSHGIPGVPSLRPPSFGAGPSVGPRPTGSNATVVCDPVPLGTPVLNGGVNFSVATTPANGSGPAPLDYAWSVSVGGGGLPPYFTSVWIWSPLDPVAANLSGYLNSSTNAVGNVTLTTPGLYDVLVMVTDSTCSQSSYVEMGLYVWDPGLGPAPVRVSANTTGGPAPAAVSYTLDTSDLPAGWSFEWPMASLGYDTSSTVQNWTYYFPGSYDAQACFVEPHGIVAACGTSPTVTVGGSSPVAMSAAVGPGPGPVNVTFWANVTQPSALPAGTLLWLVANNGTASASSRTNSSAVNLTESVLCAPPVEFVPPSGTCTFTAWLSLIGPPGSPDRGALGDDSVSVQVNATGSPTSWFPTVTVTGGPGNGSAPLNLSLNVSASGGSGPYYVDWNVFGTVSPPEYGLYLPTVNGSLAGWNGSVARWVVPLNSSGVYWVVGELRDARNDSVAFTLPWVTVGVALAPAALTVAAHEGALATPLAGTGSVDFEVAVAGGMGPYTVLWAFGDGSYGTSQSGQVFAHLYARAGTFHPTVTVTDGAGRSTSIALPTVLVAPAPNPPAVRSQPPGPASTGPTAAPLPVAALAAALVAVAGVLAFGVFLLRRAFRREGEALVDGLGPGGPEPPD